MQRELGSDGDARVRHCAACACDVVNTAQMTAREIEAMLARGGPLPCLRLARYEDGSLMVRSEQQMSSSYARMAGVAMAALVTISAVACAQKPEMVTGRKPAWMTYAGHVVDAAGKPVAHAHVSLLRQGLRGVAPTVVETNARGEFSAQVFPGEWEISASAAAQGEAAAQKVQIDFDHTKAEKPLVLQPVRVLAGAPVMKKPEPVATMGIVAPLISKPERR